MAVLIALAADVGPSRSFDVLAEAVGLAKTFGRRRRPALVDVTRPGG